MSAAKSGSATLLAVFTAVESAHAFSAFLPSYFTIRKFAGEPEDAASIRSGYLPAGVFCLALGGAVSVMAEDRRPLLFAVVVGLGMVGLYEYGIQHAQGGQHAASMVGRRTG